MNTVQELEAHIASNPSDVHAMLSLIDLYQDQGDTGDKLNQIRTQYTSYVIPDLENVFADALLHCPDVSIISEYIDTMTNLYEAENITEQMMRNVYERAVGTVGMDILHGRPIWTRYREFETDELEDHLETQSPPDIIQEAKKRLINVFLRQLANPLIDNESTLAEMDECLQEVCVESDVNIINPPALSSAYETGLELREARMPFEENVNNLQSMSEEAQIVAWRTYIEFELKDSQLYRAQRLYERALMSCSHCASLWMDFLTFAYDKLKDHSLVESITRRMIKVQSCTGEVEVWRMRYMSLELMAARSADALSTLPLAAYSTMEKAVQSSFPYKSDYFTVCKLYCDVFRRALEEVVTKGSTPENILQCVQNLYGALDFVGSYLENFLGDWESGLILYIHYRIRIEDGIIETISDSVDGTLAGTEVGSRSEEVWEKAISGSWAKSYPLWKAYILWAKTSQKDIQHCRKLYRRALKAVDSSPCKAVCVDPMSVDAVLMYDNATIVYPHEELLSSWLSFEEESGSVLDIMHVINRRQKNPNHRRCIAADSPSGRTKASKKVKQQTSNSSQEIQKETSVRPNKRAAAAVSEKTDETYAAASSNCFDNENVPKRMKIVNESNDATSKHHPTSDDVPGEVTALPTDTEGGEVEHCSTVEEDTGAVPVHSVFIKNLSFDATENDIRNALQPCGKISQVRIVCSKAGKSRGMAHADFTSATAVDRAIKLNNPKVNGRVVTIERFRNTTQGGASGDDAESYHPTTLFVSRLPKDATESELKESIVGVVSGEIIGCKVVCDKRTGRSKGHGLIQFKEKQSVEDILGASDPILIRGHAVNISRSRFPAIVETKGPSSNKYMSSSGRSTEPKQKFSSASLFSLKPRGLKVKSSTVTTSVTPQAETETTETSVDKNVSEKAPGHEAAAPKEGMSNDQFRNMFT